MGFSCQISWIHAKQAVPLFLYIPAFFNPFKSGSWLTALKQTFLKGLLSAFILWSLQQHWLLPLRIMPFLWLSCHLGVALFHWRRRADTLIWGDLPLLSFPKCSVGIWPIPRIFSWLFCSMLIYWIHPASAQVPPFGAKTMHKIIQPLQCAPRLTTQIKSYYREGQSIVLLPMMTLVVSTARGQLNKGLHHP